MELSAGPTHSSDPPCFRDYRAKTWRGIVIRPANHPPQGRPPGDDCATVQRAAELYSGRPAGWPKRPKSIERLDSQGLDFTLVMRSQ